MAQNNETETLKNEISNLKEQLKELTKDLKDMAKAKIESGKEDILEHLSAKELKEAVSKIGQKGKSEVQRVENLVKDEPIKSVAITFGIGFLLAWLIKK